MGSFNLGQHCIDHDNRITSEANQNQKEAPHSIVFSTQVDGVDLM